MRGVRGTEPGEGGPLGGPGSKVESATSYFVRTVRKHHPSRWRSWPLTGLGLAAAFAGSTSCGAPAGSSAPRAPRPGVPMETAQSSPAVASASPAASPAAPASPAASPAATASPALPVAAGLRAHAVFDKAALFVATGEDGRIGVLADDGGDVVPYRREGNAWQRLELPPSQRAKVGALQAGIFFGRDNRPRLMGYRREPARIVYLRFKDDAWRPELREIGPLGKEGPEPLFGVLGEADPEVVCRVGDRCLIKSRQGWKETPPSLPPTAVVRAFEGKGYAVTEEGVFRADDKKLVRVGPPAPWSGQPTGFWVGAGESIAVVERDAGALHLLEGEGATWQRKALPMKHPMDVAGPAKDRFIAGDGGLLHGEGEAWSSVGGATGALDRVIVAAWGIVAGGRSGVFVVSREKR